ncbi:MAG: helix-turn-helix domain-containing protein [Treponema sp.]|jgi:hypothetical protein|nr:helix-turn-helix domain-containing protein [Treponema sp.]
MRTRSREVNLTPEERRELDRFVGSETQNIKLLKRAQVILALDISEGRVPAKEAGIAGSVGVSRQTVQNTKKDFFASSDLQEFLQRKKRKTPVPVKITSEVEARIVELASGPPPEGCRKWTFRLLAEKCVELQYVDSVSHTTVSRLIKEHRVKRT